MKNKFIYIVLSFLLLANVASAQTLSQSSLSRFLTALPEPNVCDVNDKKQALIIVKGVGQYQCIGGTYQLSAGGGGTVVDATTTVKGKVLLTVAGGTAVVADNHAGIPSDLRKYGTTLLQAKTAIGASQIRVSINQAVSAASVTSLPANITLVFDKGGIITVPASTVVDIAANIEAANNQQIFSFASSGTDTLKSQLTSYVVLRSSAIKEIYPEWFGAKVDDGVDDYLAIKAAIAASSGYSNDFASRKAKAIHFSRGFYDSSKTIYFYAKTTVTGEGGGTSTAGNGDTYSATVIRFPAGVAGMYFDYFNTANSLGDSTGSSIEQLELRGTLDGSNTFSGTANGIEVRSGQIKTNSINVDTFKGHAIFINGTGGANADGFEIRNTSEAFNYGDGVRTEGIDSQVGSVSNNYALNNSGVGHNDLSLTGNEWRADHGRGNKGGDYRSGNYPNRATFVNCYSENTSGFTGTYLHNFIGDASIVLGGTLAGDAYGDAHAVGSKLAGIRQTNGALELLLPRAGLTGSLVNTLSIDAATTGFGETARMSSGNLAALDLNFPVVNATGSLSVVGALSSGSLRIADNNTLNYFLRVNLDMTAGTASFTYPGISDSTVVSVTPTTAITGTVKYSRTGTTLNFVSSVGTDAGRISMMIANQ